MEASHVGTYFILGSNLPFSSHAFYLLYGRLGIFVQSNLRHQEGYVLIKENPMYKFLLKYSNLKDDQEFEHFNSSSAKLISAVFTAFDISIYGQTSYSNQY